MGMGMGIGMGMGMVLGGGGGWGWGVGLWWGGGLGLGLGDGDGDGDGDGQYKNNVSLTDSRFVLYIQVCSFLSRATKLATKTFEPRTPPRSTHIYLVYSTLGIQPNNHI